MLALSSIIFGVVIAALAVTIGNMFDPTPRKTKRKRFFFWRKRWQIPSAGTLMRAVFIGFISAIIYVFAAKVPPEISMLFLSVAILMVFYNLIWWTKEGSEVKELVVMFVLNVLLTLVAQANAVRIYDLTDKPFLVGLIRVLPFVVLIMSTAICIANMMWFREELNSGHFDPQDFLDEEDLEYEVRVDVKGGEYV